MLTNIKYDENQRVFNYKDINDPIWDEPYMKGMRDLKYKNVIAKLRDGVYEYWDVNSPMIEGYKFEHFWYDENNHFKGCYGVCDNVDQIFERDPDIKEFIEDDNEYILTLCWIDRKKQPKEGGWRWHKWGEYIGDFDSKCEYLYDEEGIDGVFVYSINKIVSKPDE